VFLTTPPEALLTAVHGLCDLLGAPFSAARDLALSEPRLLVAPRDAVAGELEALRPLLPAPGDGGGGAAAAAAAALLRGEPRLMLPGGLGAALRARAAALAAALGVGAGDVARAAADNAEVLLAPAAGAAAAAAAMAAAGLAAGRRAADTVLAQPVLAHTDPAEVAAASAGVLAAAARHRPWAEALPAALPPAPLGLLLLQWSARRAFLDYLLETGGAGRLELAEAIALGRAERERVFGAAWVEWDMRRRARGAAREARAARRAAAVGGGGGGEGAEQEADEEEAQEGEEEYEDGEATEEEEEAEEELAEAREGGARRGPAPSRRRGDGGDAKALAVRRGIVTGWPGAPNRRARPVLRVQRAAATLYPRGTAGLLDAHWAAQAWWQEDELPPERTS
jgi:hypothetical protein